MDIRTHGPSRYRRRRCVAAIALLVGVTTALVGLAPVASAKPPSNAIESCSGSGCGPCPQGVTWRTLILGLKVGYQYTVRSATPRFYPSDARQVYNGLSSPALMTVTSQTSRTHTLTVTTGYSVDFLKVLHASVSVSIVNTTTTAIGVNVQVTVPPFSTVLAEYGMHGYDTIYDVTTYITSSEDLSRNVCLNRGTQYNQYAVAPTIVEGWRLTQL